MKRMIMLFTVLAFAGLAFSQTPTLSLNEFMASSDLCCDDGAGEMEDFVELYNYGGADVDLAGLWFTDTPADTDGVYNAWQIPSGFPETVVPAGGFIAVWFDKDSEQGPLHIEAKLSSDGEFIIMLDADGTTELINYEFGPQYTDISMARFPDYTGDFTLTMTPTPSLANIIDVPVWGCTDTEAVNYDPEANIDDGSCDYTPELFINEFLADNTTGIQDTSGEYADWIEIYNPSGEDVDLGGLFITDDLLDLTMYQIPTGYTETIVPAGGFLVLWADKDSEEGPLHVEVKLSSDGEDVALVASDGVTIIDSYTFGVQTADISKGREWDGAETWVFFDEPSPGTTNGSIEVPLLFINEFIASNDTGHQDPDDLGDDPFDDWVEIYNPGLLDIDLGGMYMADGHLELHQIPSGFPETLVPAGGFLIVYFDNEPEDGPLHIPEKLGSGGDEIHLYATDGFTVIDSYVFGAQSTDVSEGRMPDGTNNWQFFVNHPVMGFTDTPSHSNITLKINEFLAKNDNINTDEFGNYGDWVELYNYGETDVNLTGLFMTDNYDTPELYTFNPTVLPSQEYLLIWCDSSSDDPITDPDTLHTNFKLGAGGEAVGLYLNALTVIDTITFGAQTPDISMGRYPDGTDNWFTFTLPTPGVSNTMTAGPIISDVVRAPMFPEFEDAVNIIASVTTEETGLDVVLNYNAGIGYMAVAMLDDGLNNDGAAGDNIFGGFIPAHAAGTMVYWYIEASDEAPSLSLYPVGGSEDAFSYMITDWIPTAIHELTIPEPSGLAYNTNTGTLFTHNDGADSDIFEISTSGNLLATLDVSGFDFEGIAFDAAFETIYVVEESNWKVVSYTLDGTFLSEFEVAHTPGSASGLEGIMINPADGHLFVLHESNDPELIELNADGVELSRTVLDFSPDVSGITLHPEWGTLFIVSDEAQSLNEVTMAGEFLRSWYIPLDQAEGVTFGATSNVIYMVADRGNKLYEFNFNFEIFSPPSELYINEFVASNDTGLQDPDDLGDDPFDDWAEIYNATEEEVDLAGMYFADSHEILHQIPSGFSETVIAAGGFTVVWFDDEPEDGPLHIPEKLGAGGDAIYLYDVDGSVLIDSYIYEAQTTDISAGRFPDGSDNWVFFDVPTPGVSNNELSIIDSETLPTHFTLHPAYPNPFNPTTTIRFDVPESADMSVTVYNIRGEKVETLVNEHLTHGQYNVVWNANNQPSGIYFVRLVGNTTTQVQKLLLVK